MFKQTRKTLHKWIKEVFKGSGYLAVYLALVSNVSMANVDTIIPDRGMPETISVTSLMAGADPVEKTGRVLITAFSSTPDQTDDTPFITASGKHVHDGTVAANFLPFGTKIKIPKYFGDKVFVVEDRMNKRFSDRIDIWFPDRESAKNFGVRQLDFIVL